MPWLLLLAVLAWVFITNKTSSWWVEGSKETYQSLVLTKVEQMGKVELVQFNFQEVTELKKISDYIDLRLFKYKPLPDAKAVLISQGSAVGCIDLAKVQAADIQIFNDSIHISLPEPELCYFKVDLEKSRIYDLQISYMSEEEQKAFIQELYQVAEEEIRNGAMEAGILEQTKETAHSLLSPMLTGISGRIVTVSFDPSNQKVLPEDDLGGR